MVILEFNNGIPNASIGINDLVYYVANVQSQWTDNNGNPLYMSSVGEATTGVSTHIFIGHVSSILSNQPANGFTITAEEPFNTTANVPAVDDYIFFVKNNESELASIKGYFGSVTFENDSTAKAELFSVACGISESSK